MVAAGDCILDKLLVDCLACKHPCLMEFLDAVVNTTAYGYSRNGKGRGAALGFERILHIYLANCLINSLHTHGYILHMDEKIRIGSIVARYDFSLCNSSGRVIEVIEIKAIEDNNFSILKGDLNKLNLLKRSNPSVCAFLLCFRIVSGTVLGSSRKKISSFIGKLSSKGLSVHIRCWNRLLSKSLGSKSYTIDYILFEVC